MALQGCDTTTGGRLRRLAAMAAAVTALVFAVSLPVAGAAAELHGIAMHGTPALPDGFGHLPYVNPDAPKGGKITYGFTGTFDSLNPFIVQGNAPRGLNDSLTGSNVFETLMVRAQDEPFTLYPLLAKSIDVADDRSWVEFHLDPRAKFSDGQPVTPDDVAFSISLLRDKGRPLYGTRYSRIARMEPAGSDGLRLTFESGADRELALLILGYTPVLPKHAVNAATFEQSSLVPMIGSGPYTVAKVDPGTGITLMRNKDYWGRDLPVKRGLDNFDEIRIDYYRDANSYFEAFKAGLFDVHFETDPARWSTGYDFAAIKSGDVVREAVTDGTPRGMNGFVFNTRKPLFADPRVREALGLAFDFEWTNKNLYYGLYSRTGSYFQGSSLSALGRAADAAETVLLAPYAADVWPSVMDGSYLPSKSDGSGRDRTNLRQALALLSAAGYELKGTQLVSKTDGRPFQFEFLVQTREQERLALAYQGSLKVIGIDMAVRLVDATQYFDRQKNYDFDMMQFTWSASLSPGNEQSFRWSAQAADTPGTYNYAGVKSKAADAMIAALLAARSETDFDDAVRALDRVLISTRSVVPLFNLPQQWMARRTRIMTPGKVPLYGYQPVTWWAKPQ